MRTAPAVDELISILGRQATKCKTEGRYEDALSHIYESLRLKEASATDYGISLELRVSTYLDLLGRTNEAERYLLDLVEALKGAGAFGRHEFFKMKIYDKLAVIFRRRKDLMKVAEYSRLSRVHQLRGINVGLALNPELRSQYLKNIAARSTKGEGGR